MAGWNDPVVAFHGFFELRDRIAEREEAFARGLVEHLIEYALGRPYGFTDYNLADAILAESSPENHSSTGHNPSLGRQRNLQAKVSHIPS